MTFLMYWLTAGGLLLVAGGTFAQAWGALREFSGLIERLPDAARKALENNTQGQWLKRLIKQSLGSYAIPVIGPLVALFIQLRFYLRIVTDIPRNLVKIGEASGEDKDVTVCVAELIRATATWTIVSMGAVLVLAGAAIQLVLAYGGRF